MGQRGALGEGGKVGHEDGVGEAVQTPDCV